MKKRMLAALLCAAVMGTTGLSASAALTETVVMRELNASAAEWNGKTALQAGKEYVITKNVTVSKEVTVPANTKVTIKNGAKLWISSKGYLDVMGTVRIDKGGTLAVTGWLSHRGKTIANYGALNFSPKSRVYLYSRFYNKPTGVIKGEPYILAIGKVNISPESRVNSEEFQEMLLKALCADVYNKAAIDKAMTAAVETALPPAMLTELERIFAADGNMSFEQFCKEFGDKFVRQFEDEYGSIDRIGTDFIKVTDISQRLTDEEKALLNTYYKGYERVVSADVTLVLYVTMLSEYDEPTMLLEDITVKAALVGTKWYLL